MYPVSFAKQPVVSVDTEEVRQPVDQCYPDSDPPCCCPWCEMVDQQHQKTVGRVE